MDNYAEQLRQYAVCHSDDAFAALVERYLPLVYRAALRRVGGDTHRAQDITQMVFTAVARNAAALARHPDLTGWLFTTTRFIAATSLRGEAHRHAREQTVAMTANTISEPSDAAVTPPLNALVDDVIVELRQFDRQVILLRFYRGLSLAEIGAQLGATDNAIQKRVDRALDLLKTKLARRGVTSTAAAIALVLETQSTVAVPAGLTAAATGAALTCGAGASGILAGTSFMILSKLQVGLAAAVLVAASGGFVWEHRSIARLQEQVVRLETEQQRVAKERDQLRARLDESERRLASSEAKVSVTIPAPTKEESALGTWFDRVAQLRDKLNEMPQLKISVNGHQNKRDLSQRLPFMERMN